MTNKNKNTYEYQVIRALERKLHLIELRGGRCEKCGYCKNMSSFDFHHLNPKEKKFQLDSRNLSNQAMDSILIEFSKCIVICANCHREQHNPNLDMIKVRERIIEFKGSLGIIKRGINKPKCIDCFVEINYTSVRCRKCKELKSRKEGRPTKGILLKEVKKNGRKWCANKYKVHAKTIVRWIEYIAPVS